MKYAYSLSMSKNLLLGSKLELCQFKPYDLKKFFKKIRYLDY